MAIEIPLPDLGQGSEEATITYWFVEAGDQIEEGDELAEISTEDQTFSLMAPASGLLTEQCVKENGVVAVGDIIAILEEDLADDYEDLDELPDEE